GPVPHATTFGGNALACAAVNAVFSIMEELKLLARVTELGNYLGDALATLAQKFPGHVLDGRGRGLLRGIAVSGTPAQITQKARARVRKAVDADARVLRGRGVRARRQLRRAADRRLADGPRRADRGHRARARELLPGDHGPHVRAGARRRVRARVERARDQR